MTLTLGSGPLSAHPADSNYEIVGPAHRIAFEAHPRRIRAELGGRTVLDTVRGRLLHETGILPVLYAPLDDYDAALLEEDEEVGPHLRDPYHRVDARRSSRPVEVALGGELVVREAAPVLVFETGLPVRAYLDRARLDLVAGERRTACPYKGDATYWSLRVGERVLEDAAWSYEAPLDGMQAIAGLVSLDHEDLDVRIG